MDARREVSRWCDYIIPLCVSNHNLTPNVITIGAGVSVDHASARNTRRLAVVQCDMLYLLMIPL